VLTTGTQCRRHVCFDFHKAQSENRRGRDDSKPGTFGDHAEARSTESSALWVSGVVGSNNTMVTERENSKSGLVAALERAE
jgi:hypothetical protein